jgi:hypothetical protein
LFGRGTPCPGNGAAEDAGPARSARGQATESCFVDHAHAQLLRLDVEALLRGEKIDKEKNPPKPREPGRRSSVPTSGTEAKPAGPGFGQEPTPQLGA